MYSNWKDKDKSLLNINTIIRDITLEDSFWI